MTYGLYFDVNVYASASLMCVVLVSLEGDILQMFVVKGNVNQVARYRPKYVKKTLLETFPALLLFLSVEQCVFIFLLLFFQ